MLKNSFFGLLATAALVSACGGEIISSSSGPRQDPFPQDDPTCPSAAAVVSASDGWRSTTASQPAFETLEFEIMARPEANGIDGLVAVGARDIADFSDPAIVVRFAADGLIDVRDDQAYVADEAFSYEAGVWYTIAIYADIATGTYDVEVARCGEAPRTLVAGAAFTTEASVSDRLTTWAAWSSQSASLDVSIPSWVSSGSCAPATCNSLGLECGTLSNGCGGDLSCGDCGDGQTCVSGGVCTDDPAPPSSPPPPGEEPSSPPPPGEEPSSPPPPGEEPSSPPPPDEEPSSPPPSSPPPPDEEPMGPADSCPTDTPIGAACICGGSMHDTGFCCEEGFSFSACHVQARYVRPGGGGARDGSDWANALNGLPTVLERGTVYWLGAGNYGSYSFDDGMSGELGITVRKATAVAHGSDTGWNAAYGSGQAVFGTLDLSSGRYTIDGGEPNGLRTVGQMGSDATVRVGASRIVLRHVEIDGGLRKNNGVQTGGGCNGSNVTGDYVVFDRCEIHNVADDGIGIYSSDHVKVLYSTIHDLDGCGTDGGCGPCFNGHSDGLELSNISDIELVGNMVYDVQSDAAIFMDNWSGTKIRGLVAYNNVFYTPDTGFAVYLHRLDGAKIHNNVIWGKTQGSRYGGLAMGQEVTNLQMYNNIILSINYSHMGGSPDPNQHALDYNLFGVIDSGEYQANSNDLAADPRFAGIPMSGDGGDHKRSDVTLDDFGPGASEAIDTGTSSGDVPTFDVAGTARPQGGAWDRGVFEAVR